MCIRDRHRNSSSCCHPSASANIRVTHLITRLLPVPGDPWQKPRSGCSAFVRCGWPFAIASPTCSTRNSSSTRTLHQAIASDSNPLEPFPHLPAILEPNHCVLRPSHLDRACISLLSSLFSLCSLPSSLAAAHFSDRTSHMSLRSLHQAIDSASNQLHPVPHHPWPGGMREAIK